MRRSLRFCSLALALATCAALTGCGGSGGEAKFDPTGLPDQTEEQKKAALDYEAELKKQHEQQYGN